MANKTNLLKRNGRWYFNKAFPKALWPVTRTSPFRVSLNTSSLEEAQRKRPDAEKDYYEAVDAAKRKLAVPAFNAKASGQPFGEPNVLPVLAEWYHETVDFIQNTNRASLNPDQHDTALEELSNELAEAKEELATGALWMSKRLAKEALQEAGFVMGEREPFDRLVHLIARGRVELTHMQQAWLLGDYGFQPADPLIALAAKPREDTAVVNRHTIGDLIDAYRASEEHKWSPSTQSSYQPIWRLLEDVLGRHKLLSEIDRPTGRTLFEIVQKLPKNLGKKKELRGLTVPEAVKKGEQMGLETLAPKTINGTYMGFLSTVFKWGVKEQWLELNPVLELNVRDTVAPADKRDPFSANQLRELFSLAPWSPKDTSTAPLHYWGPLLALFQGMRRGEIAQLSTSDLEVSDGVLVIHVREDGGGKRIKTSAGRRTLPVHKELIRLGFAEHVEARQLSGEEKLFGGEVPNSRGQWGTSLTRWFTGLLKTNGIEGRKLGLHSFRHNFEDRLRAAELHGTDIGRELAGRSKGKDTSSSYGSGYSVTQLKAAMDKIDYSKTGFPL